MASIKILAYFVFLSLIMPRITSASSLQQDSKDSEDFQSVFERLYHLEVKYEKQSKKLDSIELKNRNLEVKLTKLETTVAKHRNQIDKLNAKIDEENGQDCNSKSSRVKRPVRMLPAYLFNRQEDDDDDEIAKNKTLEELKNKMNSNNLMPSNCKDLNSLGYTLPGIYLVKGQTTALTSNSNAYKIKLVFCNFSPSNSLRGRIPLKDLPVNEIKLGYVDVKTGPMTRFCAKGVVRFAGNQVNETISYNEALYNVEQALNITTGIVTIPKRGVYSFFFAGTANSRGAGYTILSTIYVSIHLNDTIVATTVTLGHGTSLYLTSTLELNQGDRIYLSKNVARKYPGLFRPGTDDFNLQFCGRLIEEDLQL